MEPGEIYLADFPEAGPHPVIVVSREELNRGHYALVVVCTSARFAVRSQLASCVPFHAGQFGFTADCVAQCENANLNQRAGRVAPLPRELPGCRPRDAMLLGPAAPLGLTMLLMDVEAPHR
jgi:mRNA-degrading endonuclease toxin of MazEF toxin-antitoxin module